MDTSSLSAGMTTENTSVSSAQSEPVGMPGPGDLPVSGVDGNPAESIRMIRFHPLVQLEISLCHNVR